MNGDIGTLQRAEYQDLTLARLDADFGGRVAPEALIGLLETMRREELWLCAEYQVAVDKTPAHGFRGFTIWHLSIKRRDKESIHDWRDLQAIKNQLCGADVEAIELYPAEARKVDSANQYHLFAFMRSGKRRAPKLPLGWTVRFVSDEQFINGKQRVGAAT
jgi:hypothetical protein